MEPGQFEFTLAAIKAAGFDGVVTVAELQATNCAHVPAVKGVYLFLRQSASPPEFLIENPTLPRNGRSPTLEISRLESNWVPGSPVVYIGKAGTTLQKRLRAFMKHGQGKVKHHWGGRCIWQLADSSELVIYWKATEGDPAAFESGLIQRFKAIYGRRPFDNLRD